MTKTSCCIPHSGPTTGDLAGSPAPGACPTNGQVGKGVDSLTLKAMLALPLTCVAPVEYRFCYAPDCSTVYYSVEGAQCFSEADLRERVYQKHPADDEIFVCYCFRHTIGSIRAELRQTSSTSVIEAITAGIQAGQCACDIRNPQGSCCLGNVRAVVQRFKNEAVLPAQP
jgi:hypothetical protein